MTGKYYSFVVWATDEVTLPEYHLVLDRGLNVFTATLEDVGAFRVLLHEANVVVRQVNLLDESKSFASEVPQLRCK